MPIFEYQCHQCGKVSEKIQARPQVGINCPTCSATAVRRVSRTAIRTSGTACGPNNKAGFT